MDTNKNLHPLNKQVGGDHYKTMRIQPIEYILENGLGWCEGNIVKYITRHHQKGGKADVEKVIHYAEMLLAEYEAQEVDERLRELLVRDTAPHLGELSEEEWQSIFNSSKQWDGEPRQMSDHQGVESEMNLSERFPPQSSPQLELPLKPDKPETETPEYLRPVLSYEVRYGPYDSLWSYGRGIGSR